MGIRVRHDPPIQNVGNMAVAIGQGQRKDRNQEFDTATRQRDRALDLQELSIRSQLSEGHANRAVQMQMQEAGHRNSMQMQTAAHSQYMDRMAFQDELTKGRIQFEYTEQQKREMEKNAQGIAWVQNQVASGQWTPEQGQKAIRQLEAKLLGIQPVPSYDDTPTGMDIFRKNLIIDPETGNRFFLEGGGRLRPLDDALQIGFSDFAKLYQEIGKAMATMDADGNIITADPKRVTEAVMSIIAGYNMLRKANMDDPQDQQAASAGYNQRMGMPQGSGAYMQQMGIPEDAGYVPEPGPSQSQQPQQAVLEHFEEIMNSQTVSPKAKAELLKRHPERATLELLGDIYGRIVLDELGKNAGYAQFEKRFKELLKQDGWTYANAH
jgi:hypothetical protein